MINLAQQGYTHDQIIRMLHFPDGVDRSRYKLEILRQNVVIGLADYTECSFECNYFNQVKFAGSARIKDDPRINWNIDFLRPVKMWDLPDATLEFPFVPLKPMTVSDEIQDNVIFKNIEMYDESIVLQGNSLGETVLFPAGTSYLAAVEELLFKANFMNVSIHPSNKTLKTDRIFEPGEELLTIANTLLGEINYRSLEMGRDGILTSFEYVLPSIEQAQIHYRADNKSVMEPEKSLERDSFKQPNRFIGFMANPDIEIPLRYEFVNTSPASPTSTVNQRYIITAPPRQYDNVADYDTLVSLVQRWATETEQSYEHIKMTTSIMPHHKVREVITVDAFGVNGVFTETGWRITNFSHDGKMEHDLRAIV